MVILFIFIDAAAGAGADMVLRRSDSAGAVIFLGSVFLVVFVIKDY